jgi:hypothetical protein
MRKEVIDDFLIRAISNWSVIKKLLHQNKLTKLSYQKIYSILENLKLTNLQILIASDRNAHA